MKDIKITAQKYYCKFCKKPIEGGRGYLANPFCNDAACRDMRLEASGSVDLRDNCKIIDHGNGFVSNVPIDPNKLWKASDENRKIIEERIKKYNEENAD